MGREGCGGERTGWWGEKGVAGREGVGGERRGWRGEKGDN